MLEQAASELEVRNIRVLTWDQTDSLQLGDAKILVEPVRQWLVQSSD